jgi:hypothetical protein
MKFLNFLNDDYVAAYGNCEIFSWPSSRELIKEIKSGYVRFFYLNKTLYVFDANNATHWEITNQLGKRYTDMVFWGIGTVKGGKINVDTHDSENWGNEIHFKSNSQPIFSKCKNYFYNYKEILDYMSEQNESYVTGFKPYIKDGYVEIFSDPDSSEIQKFYGKNIRWAIIADKLYIFDGDLSTHLRVAGELGFGYHDILLSGVAHVENKKLKYHTGYDLFYTDSRHVYNRVQKFKSYFTNFNIMMSDLKELLGE